MMPKPPLHKHADWILLLLRLSMGATFIAHGVMKWAMFDAPAATPLAMLMKILAVAEPIAGAMLLVGMAMEVSATATALVMLGAIWTKFAGGGGFVGKNAWEFEFLLLVGSLVLLAFGPGMWSLDAACSHEEKHWWQFWKRG
jgi:putative oxidoreductase